ncbi:MAG: AlpA family phage regulatory protein [Chromatiales bacterium]|jgi:predicted DNA-binding transcriptional regulator AlpA
MRKIIFKRDVPISNTVLWQLQKDGLFPHSFKLHGSKTVAWYSDEIDRVLALRAAGATDDQVREIVRQIHIERQKAAEAILSNGGAA